MNNAEPQNGPTRDRFHISGRKKILALGFTQEQGEGVSVKCLWTLQPEARQ
jgi:hypothetical protein